jgi:hypothetical protein
MARPIQPGGFSNLFNQHLLRALSLQLTQMLAGGGTPGLIRPIANLALLNTVDASLGMTMQGIDTQLAMVGISPNSGLPNVQQPTPGLINGRPGQVGGQVPLTGAPNVRPPVVGQPAPVAAPTAIQPNVISLQRTLGVG